MNLLTDLAVRGTRLRPLVGALAFGIVLWLNALAGSGALSGESIGTIANRYPSAFLPAGYVFGIWSVIYAGLFAYVVDLALPGRGSTGLHVRIGWMWPVNAALNVGWIVAFSFGLFVPAIVLMVGLLVSLITIHMRVGDPRGLSLRDRVLVALPFGLYLSWISVALIANAFQLAVAYRWSGFGIDEAIWAVIMMTVATALGGYMGRVRGVGVFLPVVAWALVGIALRNAGAPLVAVPAWALSGVCTLIFLSLIPRSIARVGIAVGALVCGASVGIAAQEASLRGRVMDAADLRPLQGATVTVLPSGSRLLTDGDGRFGVAGLTPGLVSIRLEYIGYASALKAEVVVQASRPTYVEFRLDRQAIELQGLVVGAPAFEIPEAAPTSVQILSNEELRRTPGGLLDISRTLLSLPGVLGGVDNRNDLLVRGGGPGENAYVLDGIRVPQINHFATQGASGGAIGLVNVDFIRKAEFLSGAFPARYGDAMSSVLSIENRPGSSDGIHGDVTLGATEAAITLDGPAGEDANWLFSVRRSYLQFLFQALGLPIRPDYWDGQFRVEVEPTDRDRFLIVGLGAVDNFGIVAPTDGDDYANFEIFERVIDNDQKSMTVGGSWRRLISGGYVTSTVSWSGTDYSFKDPGSDGAPVLLNESFERDTRLAVQADLALGDRATMHVGVDADRAALDVRLFQRAVPGGSLSENLAWDTGTTAWKLAAHAQLTGDIGTRLTLSAGIRADEVTGLESGFSLSPRVSGSLALGRDVSFQAAAGVFHQAPNLLSLSVAEAGQPVNLGLRQQKNRQVATGLSWIPTPGLRLSAEGFWKEYDRVPIFRDDPRIALPNLGGDYGFVGAEPLTDDGTGRAYGLEIFAQQKLLDRLYFLGAYTLSKSSFAAGNALLRPSAWDRRHALDVTSGFRPGGGWEFGGKIRWLSGLATTPWDLQASEESYAVTGRGVPDWDRIGDIRTPGYVRLDLRVDRRLSRAGWNAVFYVDLQNVLNRQNVVGFTYTENPAYPNRVMPIDGSGFLPTFGFSIEF